jgi:plastocyanin
MEPKKILNFKEFALLEAIYGDIESGNKNINQEAFKKMRACIFFLNGTHPFFASLLARLVIRENRNLRHKTMATDGLSIHYDPDFVLALPPDEIKWVIAHEIMHNVLQHFLRCPKDETMNGIWNVACDYALNQIISPPTMESGKPEPDRKSSIGNMPSGSLYPGCGQHTNDERFLGLSAEQIYEILKKEGFTPDVPPAETAPPPPPPPPPAPPKDPTVGDVIFDAANNTYGVVTSYDNVSKEVEYDPIPKEKIKEFAKNSGPNF